jgi:hypothetical protein
MKKMFAQIKNLKWYDENKDDHGIVYLDKEKNDGDFFSRGQSEFLGRLSEVIAVDKSNNYKLLIDNSEYIWKEWMFVNVEEKEVNNENIIDVEYKEDHEIILEDKEIHETIMIEDKRNTVEFKTDIINDINSWGLSFNLGTAIINLITANKNNIDGYKNQIEISLLCLENELKEIKKEK